MSNVIINLNIINLIKTLNARLRQPVSHGDLTKYCEMELLEVLHDILDELEFQSYFE